MRLGLAGITAQILHANSVAKTENHGSLVLLVNMFGVRLLLTGDIMADSTTHSVEKLLVDAHAAKRIDLQAHIVQVPHHGSDTSSSQEFIDAVVINKGKASDTYAVISSGPVAYNGTQLPISTIVTRWENALKDGRVLSTKLYDDDPGTSNRPHCSKHPKKIAPRPVVDDETAAGCNNIQFVIKKGSSGGKIESALFWPLGPKIP